MANDAFAAYSSRTGKPLPIHHFEFADDAALVNGVGISKPYPDFTLGAVHSSIINYLFPHFSNNRRIDAPDLPQDSRALADQLLQSWASFARSGAPTAAGISNWPPYSGQGSSTMRFAPGKVALHDAATTHRCGFWKSLYPEALR